MPTISSIAEILKNRKEDVKKDIAAKTGSSVKEVDAALPNTASILRGAKSAQEQGQDLSKINPIDLKALDPLKSSSEKSEPSKGMSNQDKISLALIGTIPALLGYAVGGNSGGETGAKAGVLGVTLADTQYRQDKKDQREIDKNAAALGLKADQINVGKDRNKIAAESNIIRAMDTDRREEGTENKKQFDKLPQENKQTINHLAQKNAGIISISNQIDNTVKVFDDPKVPQAQKIIQGKQLLKTLNSTQGSDAIGAEESRRLGSFLELLPFGRPGWDLGVQMDKFRDQAAITSNTIKDTIRSNQDVIDSAMSGKAFKISDNIPIKGKTKKVEDNQIKKVNPSGMPDFDSMTSEELEEYLGGK